MKKIMKENFDLLKSRIIDVNKSTDLDNVRNQINSMEGNTICVGVGGSKVVAEYASKVLNKIKNDIVICLEPRDINYVDLYKYNNIFLCSYSGSNSTLKLIKNNNLNKYLFTNNSDIKKGIKSIIYNNKIEKELSFISLASTLMPMSILLRCYLNITELEFEKLIDNMFDNIDINVTGNKVYEIMYGIENKVAASYLESTLVESGISIPIMHDKYSFCHGRNTTPSKIDSGLIFIGYNNTSLDKLLIKETTPYYSEVIRIDNIFEDELINEFYLTLLSMYFTRDLALIYNEDLSGILHGPITCKVYGFSGDM